MDHVVLGPGTIPPAPVDSSCAHEFKQARFYRQGRRGFGIVYVLLHVAECAEVNSAADNLCSYCASMPDGRVASWTYATDRYSVTQSVREADTAFHAPPLNDCSIGIESAGFSSQLDADWADDYSRDMLDRFETLVADVCRRHGIPARVVPDDALLAALPQLTALAGRGHIYGGPTEPTIAVTWEQAASIFGGILTHAQVSRVFKKSAHYDPGAHFPLDDFVRKVAARVASAA